MTLPMERADGPTLFGGGWAAQGPRVALQTAARTNRRWHAMRHATRLGTLVLADVVGIVGAMLLMVVVNPAAGFGQVGHRYDPTAGALARVAQAVVAVCSGLWVLRAYESGDTDHDLRRVVFGVSVGLLVLYWAMLWQDGGTLLDAYLPAVAIFGGSIWASRQLRQRVLRHVWPHSLEPARVLFVGSAREIEAVMQRRPFHGVHAVAPIAHLDLAHERAIHGSDAGVIESLLQASIHDHEIDTTLLCSQYTDDELSRIVGTADAAGCRVISLSRT